MPLRPMPIFHHVANRAPVHDALTGELLSEPRWLYEPTRKAAMESFKVDAQVTAELYYRGNQDKYDLRKHFGSLRLPYPNMWIEWDMPPVMKLNGKDVPVGHSVRMAALLSEFEGRGCLQTVASLFISSANRMFAPAIHDIVTMDHDGNYLDRQHASGYSGRQGVQFLQDLHVAYLSVNLMHCKNVTTEKVEPQVRGSRDPKKRKRNCGVEYHTIVLPGMSGASNGSGECQDVMALHRVRGHFKTYTADAPLLGKYTGTYWWGWQVRGNKKNGVVVSDYKLGPDAALTA